MRGRPLSPETPLALTMLAELRRAFDRSFAEAPVTDALPQDDLLAIGIGGDPYAVRLSEVAGLMNDKRVTGLPGSVPELLGLAGLRGTLLPIYDLRALLGYPQGAVPRWLFVIANANAPVGLAFDQFDGHLRVPRQARAGERSPDTRSPHVREVVLAAGLARPVIHIVSVLEAIETLVRQRRRSEDR